MEAEAAAADEAPDSLVERLTRAKDRNSSYGSAARRAGRHKRPKELPPVPLGDHFLDRNVRLAGDVNKANEDVAVYKDDSSIQARASHPEDAAPSPRYQLHQAIWDEIAATVSASLTLPTPAHAETFPAVKSHVLLQCPKDGSTFFLDAVVARIAAGAGADLIKLDAQDIAEVAGNYLAEKPELTPYTIRSLGYEAHFVGRQESRELDEEADEENDAAEDEDEDSSPMPRSRPSVGLPTITKIGAIPIGTFTGSMDDLLKSSKMLFGNNQSGPRANAFTRQTSRLQTAMQDHSEADKLSGVALAFLASSQLKRQRVAGPSASSAEEDTIVPTTAATEANSTPPAIVMIRDYKEIQATTHGRNLLAMIHEQVRNLRRAGSRVILIGTVSSADLMPSLSKAGVRHVQSEYEDGAARTIIVTPRRSMEQDRVFSEDECKRTRDINLRHLRDMIRLRISDRVGTAAIAGNTALQLESSVEFSSGLEESVWTYDRVHRVAVAALGSVGDQETELTTAHVEAGLRLMHASDELKFQWASDERQQQRLMDEPALGTEQVSHRWCRRGRPTRRTG